MTLSKTQRPKACRRRTLGLMAEPDSPFCSRRLKSSSKKPPVRPPSTVGPSSVRLNRERLVATAEDAGGHRRRNPAYGAWMIRPARS